MHILCNKSSNYYTEQRHLSVVVVVESPKYIRIPVPGPVAAAGWRSVQARQAAHCPGCCKIAA